MGCKCIVPHAYAVPVKRKWWMHGLPFLAYYRCWHCEATYMHRKGLARR